MLKLNRFQAVQRGLITGGYHYSRVLFGYGLRELKAMSNHYVFDVLSCLLVCTDWSKNFKQKIILTVRFGSQNVITDQMNRLLAGLVLAKSF